MSSSPPPDPHATRPVNPADAPTHTLKQDVGGSSTEVTKAGPEQLPQHLSSIQFWQVGRQVGDFNLLAKLGEGGLGTVYLARQVSLARLVALKVTDATVSGTGEGLALAGLEHEHIVKVFAGFVEPTTKKHCLCLQYVPGTTLVAVIRKLHAGGRRPKSGQEILDAIDILASSEIHFDPTALADRGALADDDFYSAVCRLGEQMAAALAFAHSRDILHCDVKPGNILVTHYGRPMLVDFNISVKSADGGATLGGTPRYMSPEHVAAFRGDPHDPVDHRTDIFSLGVVLFELATGERPANNNLHLFGELPRELAWVLSRCLQHRPQDRYESGSELAAALAGARSLIRVRHDLPRPGALGRAAIRYPLVVLLTLAMIPHLFGSVLNITYNDVKIQLTDYQHEVFTRIALIYNGIMYPICVAAGVVLLRRFARDRRAVLNGDPCARTIDQVRYDAVLLGHFGIAFALVGWLPGGVLFPLLLDWQAGPLDWHDYAHFAISFTLSGLVGMVYSYFGIQYVVLRVLYPQLGNPDTFDPQTTRDELRTGTRWLGAFLVLATLIPLAGAIFLIVLNDATMTLGFRILVTGLIVLGMAGVTVLVRVMDRMAALVAPWTTGGAKRHGSANWSAVWRSR
ncbi:serine/threonine-protein kinase [Limnoglobus roseus]|uniref:Serine/threonine protein kinase n=1 Tax=Limnoglobus roseus TaxID=2598579 RepID=A0A5C1AF40_9BACT|nr:serine/threonine-protein kinase [Limnoglobus roseus]QEL17175.1 serine/threonine protein kinase [Limnoglobus roseus]